MEVFPKAMSKHMKLNNLSIVASVKPSVGIYGLCCILKDCILSCWITVLVVYSSVAKTSFTMLYSTINWTFHNAVHKIWQAEQSISVEYFPGVQSDVMALCSSGNSLWVHPWTTAIKFLTGVVSHSKCISITLAPQYWGNSKSRSCPCNLRQNWDKCKLMCWEECPKFGTSFRHHGQIARPLWAMGFTRKGRGIWEGMLGSCHPDRLMLFLLPTHPSAYSSCRTYWNLSLSPH